MLILGLGFWIRVRHATWEFMPRVDPHPLTRAGNTAFLILYSTKPDLNGRINRVKPVIMANLWVRCSVYCD